MHISRLSTPQRPDRVSPYVEAATKSSTARKYSLTRQNRSSSSESSVASTSTLKQMKQIYTQMSQLESDLKYLQTAYSDMAQDNITFMRAMRILDDRNDELIEKLHSSEYNRGILRMHLENRDELLGSMSHKIQFLEERISFFLQRNPDNDFADRTLICNLCCSDTPLHKVSWCRNPDSPHPICHTCISKTMKAKNLNPCIDLTASLKCLSIHEDCIHEMSGMECTEEGSIFSNNMCIMKTMSRVCDMLRSTNCSNSSNLQAVMFRLMYLQQDGTYRGLQCRRCGHGPMWNDQCDDLVSHHDQVEGTSAINNGCPKCGIMVHNTSEMQRWDGNLPTDQSQT